MDLRSRLKLVRPQAALQQEPPNWYRIANEVATGTADEVDIYLYGSIGGWWGIDATEFVHEVMAIDAKQLNVHINSPGGSVFDGIAIFQALRNHKARIVTYVDSLAASAASFIAMAGDQRIVSPYGSLMIHEAWGLAIGNAADMTKLAEELDRLSGTIAAIYAKRAGGDREEWRTAMRDETWYSADEAVEAGLAHEVQEDAEKTGDGDASNAFDLSIFNYAGRDKAPAPRIPSGSAPAAWTDADDLMSRLVDSLTGAGWQKSSTQASAAKADPEPPAAEPDQPTEPTEEDPVSDLTELRSRLGLADDADETAIVAAVDALKAKAEEPREPTPDPEQEKAIKAQAEENTRLAKEVELLAARMETVTTELAAAKAEKAAATKKTVLDEAEQQGKFRPADRAQWEDDYDEAPQAVTRMLDRIAPGTAVPVAAVGETTNPDEGSGTFSQAEYDRLFSKPLPTGKDA